MTTAALSVAAQGSAAFDALYRAEFRRVTRIARRIVADEAEAEDVAQEVFAALARRPEPLGDNAPAWLYASAVRRALNAARSRRRRTVREDRVAGCRPPALVEDADPLATIVRTERVSAIRSVMRRLKPRDAALLAMRYGGDLSYREIAEALAVPPEHVGPLLARARAAFAREVHRAPRAIVIALGTTLAVLLALAVLPPVRAFATDVARRLHLVPVSHSQFRTGGMTFIGSDLQRLTASTFRTERVRGAGFRVRIPYGLEGALRSPRRLHAERFRMHTTYRLDADRARAAGMTLPPDLDGATIDVAVGPIVEVNYEGETVQQTHVPQLGERVAISEVAVPVVVVRHATTRRLAE